MFLVLDASHLNGGFTEEERTLHAGQMVDGGTRTLLYAAAINNEGRSIAVSTCHIVAMSGRLSALVKGVAWGVETGSRYYYCCTVV